MALSRSRGIFRCLLLVFTFSPLIRAGQHGHPSTTLHVRPDRKTDGQEYLSGVGESKASGAQVAPTLFAGLGERTARSPRSTSPSEDAKFNTTLFTLNDSHTQLIVHWAGQGSNVVVTLAKNIAPQRKNGSSIYISYDRGRSFTDQTAHFRVDGKPAMISKFFNSPVYSSHYIFTDTENNYIFTTTDYGRNIKLNQVPFSPEVVSLHITNEKVILAMDKTDVEKKLWLSEDFGETWSPMQIHVKSFSWGIKGIDGENDVFVERLEPSGTSTLLRSSDFFKNEYNTNVLVTHIEDFQIQDKYIFATKKEHLLGTHVHDKTLQLWVSYKRGNFQLARFPKTDFNMDFFIADASENQVFVCVNHQDLYTNLYMSDVTGVHYSLSLERIFYFNPEGPGKESWIGYVTEESFADFHKVSGLKGIYIASQLKKDYHVGGLGPDDLTTLITFDSGGEWAPLSSPKTDQHGIPIICNLKENCSLHLTQRFSQLYPVSRSYPVQTRASAIGLIIASGVLGKSLKGHPAIFLSTDSGTTWHKILDGNYLYAFGDHGGVIVAVSAYNGEGPTKELLYSIDEGETWEKMDFTSQPIRVYGLMTEPGERTTAFTLFGSRLDKHQWQIITIDLRSAFGHQCSADDYKLWAPSDNEHRRYRCILGKQEEYQRRIATAKCYNGEEFERVVSIKKCFCQQEDYECDEGYKWMIANKSCVLDSDLGMFSSIPSFCLPGTFYNQSKGYRKVPGNECEGGLSQQFEPRLLPCPFPPKQEFVLFTQRKTISRMVLSEDMQIEQLPIPNLKNVIAVEYDFINNTIYWADIDDDVIMRLRLDGLSEPEILVETSLASIEGLALDWMSNNLYFVDGELGKIEIIRTDVHHMGRMRRTILNYPSIEKPRGIALHPVKGFMFFSEWASKNPTISRASLDGSDLIHLVTSPIVHWPNGISIDYQTDTIYWVDARLDYIASADFDGKAMKKLISLSSIVPHPFAIGIYKDWMYWDDWTRQEILVANKFTGKGVKVLAAELRGIMDLKIYDRSVRKGTNACDPANHACTYLCIVLPEGKHTCRCPDGFQVTKKDGDEVCSCQDGMQMYPNGTCRTSSVCKAEEFQCSGGKLCIPSIWKCDGEDDCGNNSDEEHCGDQTCSEDQFSCKDGTCIPKPWRCDLDLDCHDGSDENECKHNTCSASEFTCKNGRCINKRWRCDMDDDCRDGSDEVNCTAISPHTTCHSSEFKCATGDQCLLQSWRCDGDKDCADGSDEMNCTNHTCLSWQFQCHNGSCIFSAWQCDGDFDCLDHSDEEHCNKTLAPTSASPTLPPVPSSCASWAFTCGNGQCIQLWWQCDHVKDCSDGSDEFDCNYSTTSTSSTLPSVPRTPSIHVCRENHFQCYNGDCIWASWICDGEQDCASGEDEKNCTDSCALGSFRCLHSFGCITMTQVCNGARDCADGSDEEGCTMHTIPFNPKENCDDDMFGCATGICISLSKRCDNKTDCLDGSDEANCAVGEVPGDYELKLLEVDAKSVTKDSFTAYWLAPHYTKPFEYMPSIREHTLNKTWQNKTWTYETHFKFTSLKPYTWYNLTVYLRPKGMQHIANPVKYFIERTLPDIPSPPRNLTLRQNEDVIEWQPPLYPNGIVNGYRIYVSPPNPPRYDEVMSPNITKYSLKDLKAQDILESLSPGTNHTFWVTAIAQDMESNSSNHVNLLDKEKILLEEIKNLVVKQRENCSVTLDWNNINESVEGFNVSAITSDALLHYHVQSTRQPPITVKGLSPGTDYVLKVVSFKDGRQSLPVDIHVRTQGKPLNEPTNVRSRALPNGTAQLSWGIPNDTRRINWEYGIYYGAGMSYIQKHGVVGRTKSLNYVLTDLQPCKSYMVFVRVVGPYGFGPPCEAHRLHTAFHPSAKPQALTASEPSNFSVIISWEAACDFVPVPISYMVRIKDLVINEEYVSQTVATTESLIKFPVQVARGGVYTVEVQAAGDHAEMTETVRFVGPPILPPHQLKLVKSGSSLELVWNVRDIPKDVSYSFVVLASETEDFSNAQTFEVNEARMSLEQLKTGHLYQVAVQFKLAPGYTSALSETVSVLKPIDDDIIVFNTNTLVGIVSAVVVIVILLLASLTFLLVRHKRLKRATLSFANSHYNTRSGATTFSTGDDLGDFVDEEDSPMIHGFSDDEPLVIA